MAQDRPKFLTVAQVAERLTEAGIIVSEETVRYWARNRRIPVVITPSGRYRFPTGAVDKILEPLAVASREPTAEPEQVAS